MIFLWNRIAGVQCYDEPIEANKRGKRRSGRETTDRCFPVSRSQQFECQVSERKGKLEATVD